MNLTEKILSEDEYIISAIPVELIDPIWPLVKDHLQKVIDISRGEVTLEALHKRFMKTDAILITINRGKEIVAVNTLEIRTSDDGKRSLFIPVTGGSELEMWMDQFLEVAKSIAKEHNCIRLRGLAARKGWLRKLKPLGWETIYHVVEYKLEDL